MPWRRHMQPARVGGEHHPDRWLRARRCARLRARARARARAELLPRPRGAAARRARGHDSAVRRRAARNDARPVHAVEQLLLLLRQQSLPLAQLQCR